MSCYAVPYNKDPVGRYSGGTRIVVSRSVQRLTLLLPNEEQSDKLIVENNLLKKSSQEEKLRK